MARPPAPAPVRCAGTGLRNPSLTIHPKQSLKQFGVTWPREWPVMCKRSTTLLTGTQHWQWSQRSASRCGHPRRFQCEQGAGAQGWHCLQHHPGHPSDCEHGARRLVCAPISFSSMISRAAWSQSILQVLHGMHWWDCGMQSKGCCKTKSSSEQFGTSSYVHKLCDEQATRCVHDTLVQQPGRRWRGES